MYVTERKPGWAEELKAFILRGNVFELAVAIVIGIAFGVVVTALIDGVIMPLIAAIAGKPNFDALVLTVGSGRILYGTFLTALVNFVIVASVLFVMVKTVARLQKPKVIDLEEQGPSETELLTEIRDLLAQARAAEKRQEIR